MLERSYNVILLTVHPDLLPETLLERVDAMLAVGANAHETLTNFTRMSKQPAPQIDSTPLEPGEFFLWLKESAFRRTKSWGIPAKWRIDTAANLPKISFPQSAASPFADRSIGGHNVMLFLQIGDVLMTRHGSAPGGAAAERAGSLTKVTPQESRA